MYIYIHIYIHTYVHIFLHLNIILCNYVIYDRAETQLSETKAGGKSSTLNIFQYVVDFKLYTTVRIPSLTAAHCVNIQLQQK